MKPQPNSQNLHDAEIVGIFHDRETEKLKIQLKLPTGNDYSVEFEKVVYFRVSDFIHQNVLSEMHIIFGNYLPIHDIEFLVRWTTSLSDADSFLSKLKFGAICSEIQTAKAFLAQFVPSRGTEICVIARDESFLLQKSK